MDELRPAAENRAPTSPEANRRLSRRRFMLLAAGGLMAGACGSGKEVVRRVASDAVAEPTPVASTPTPQPLVVPTMAAPAPRPAESSVIGRPVVAENPSGRPSPVAPAAPARTAAYANRALPAERLIIPSIELDAKVVQIGTKTDKNGKLAWETAAFAVGHHQGTGMPGEGGNVVLSGHISSPREGAVFQRLPEVKIDDGIVVVSGDRHCLYRVRETKVVTPNAVDVLDPVDRPMATLITCVPDGVYSHRLIVRAEAI